MTRGENIRRMVQTDGGLADFMIGHGMDDVIGCCKNKPECGGLLDNGGAPPGGWCRQCLVDWIKEENNGQI